MFFQSLCEPAIILITIVFCYFLVTTLFNYSKVEKNLCAVYQFLNKLNKKEISYRFDNLDKFMSENPYTAMPWNDMKKTLIFPEKIFSNSNRSASDYISDIYLTVDASYFFNEDTLIQSKINYKFIQAMPTIITGLGPFFTFLKMAMAFSTLNFADTANVANSLGTLLDNIQIAALCSVFAVGYSLTFILLEKIMYNKKCKRNFILIQKEFIRLFDIITSETFLLDLVKESKIQNIKNEKILKEIPESIALALTKSLSATTTPFLENILYSLNKLNENIDKGSNGDVVDKLF